MNSPFFDWLFAVVRPIAADGSVDAMGREC